MTAVSYTLLVDGAPMDAEVMGAIQQIEVEEHADMADILRMRVATAVSEDGAAWTVVDDNVIGRLTEIELRITVGAGLPGFVFKGHIAELNAVYANQPGESYLEVVALDPTVLMNLEQKVRAWPDMADGDIASTIFSEYGFTPDVDTTQPTRQETDVTTIQRGTDIQFLTKLARRNGFDCYVEVDPLMGTTQGHFHPPRLDESPQGVLSVNLGEATNVDNFRARYDMLRPTSATAGGLTIGEQSVESGESASTDADELGSESLLGGDSPRVLLPSRTALFDGGELQTYVQGLVNRSSFAVVADGELHTSAYGDILRAKRPVNVRGAGRMFSGTYYVEKVLLTLSGETNTQAFTLRRNALGLSGQESFVEDLAL